MTNDSKALKAFTTFRIGGKPLFYSRPENYSELFDALRLCRKRELDFKILGGGSNILVDDTGLRFGVIHICSPGFGWIEYAGNNRLRIGGGVSLRAMLRYCKENGLGGAEFLAGIPGTVGGAIAGNAGAHGLSVGSLVKYVTVVDKRRYRLSGEDIDFSYRSVRGLEGAVITEAELELSPRSPELIEEQIKNNIAGKKAAQPTGKPNAGCIFKNPGEKSAGRLLDLCGFKGRVRGGVRVSGDHANFICNHRRGSARDVFFMIKEMKKVVKEEFGIDLELEIKHWKGQENAKVA